MILGQKTLSICDRPNVTNCDRCVLSLLRPHLAQTEEHQLEGSQLQQLLNQFKQVLDQGGVIRLAIDGQVQFMTPRAEQLLSQYFEPCASPSLPKILQHWFTHQILQLTSDDPSPYLSLQREQAGRQLIIRLIPDPVRGYYLLLLEEQQSVSFSIAALESLGLTQREAEVLFWVAQDKSNAAIAKVLDCCEGTVRKHLEHLYKKLEVQTRMGAVMTALERLGLLQA
ncbi:MAG: helix-turn-helix transcriptional regulator [Oscillatoriophycideae cyanobacterium NC_groundwater_1537_Pr4_S-0.65um_50_18]|nr:helix-turn-helix transcriptional regulator [Oscillatoriophycideae cyanobacterium NC_groundwater_1537_Pr4_S-0.65um_50_18]